MPAYPSRVDAVEGIDALPDAVEDVLWWVGGWVCGMRWWTLYMGGWMNIRLGLWMSKEWVGGWVDYIP